MTTEEGKSVRTEEELARVSLAYICVFLVQMNPDHQIEINGCYRFGIRVSLVRVFIGLLRAERALAGPTLGSRMVWFGCSLFLKAELRLIYFRI